MKCYNKKGNPMGLPFFVFQPLIVGNLYDHTAPTLFQLTKGLVKIPKLF
jgi:hypothetical protein